MRSLAFATVAALMLAGVAGPAAAQQCAGAAPAVSVEQAGLGLVWTPNPADRSATLAVSDSSGNPRVYLFVYDAPAGTWVLSRAQAPEMRYGRAHPLWSKNSLEEILELTLPDPQSARRAVALFAGASARAASPLDAQEVDGGQSTDRGDGKKKLGERIRGGFTRLIRSKPLGGH